MENLFWLGFAGALIALIFALTQAKKVLKFSEGTELMQKLASSIRKGANAYLKRQYTTVAKIFIIVFLFFRYTSLLFVSAKKTSNFWRKALSNSFQRNWGNRWKGWLRSS